MDGVVTGVAYFFLFNQDLIQYFALQVNITVNKPTSAMRRHFCLRPTRKVVKEDQKAHPSCKQCDVREEESTRDRIASKNDTEKVEKRAVYRIDDATDTLALLHPKD